MAAYDLLITGAGRSGTHFMTALCQYHGIAIEHEKIGPRGMASWYQAVPAYRRHCGYSFACIVHLHRHPLGVINSMQTALPQSWQFIRTFVPACGHDDRVVAAARYWVAWNRMAAEQARMSFGIRDYERGMGAIAAALGDTLKTPFEPDSGLMTATRRQAASYGGLSRIDELAERDRDTWAQVLEVMEALGYTRDQEA